MKRRSFIKNIGVLSTSISISAGFDKKVFKPTQSFNQIQHLTLKEFEEEHEEYPSLSTNHHGKSWLFSLRRLPYPENKELISAFVHKDNTWKEIEPVTKMAGQYEYPVSDCAPKGFPIIAWSRLIDDEWSIEVSMALAEGFSDPYAFKPENGKYIKPVLLASKSKRVWLAWENYENGRFSIVLTKYENEQWTKPMNIDHEKESLFDPALEEDIDGNLYLAYGITSGVHQNIEMKKIDGTSMNILKDIPVAIGGSLKERVNINAHPALGLDKLRRLWISWENNRKTHRLEDGDNFTGDRICAMVCYEDGVLKGSTKPGKWLFDGKNDHLPTFIKDEQGELFVVSHCGGDFVGNPFWKYRLSKLDVDSGWSNPDIVLETKQKGQTHKPSLIINEETGCWLATRPEKWFEKSNTNYHRSRLSKLELHQFSLDKTQFSATNNKLEFIPTVVEELLPNTQNMFAISGRKKVSRRTLQHKGETYTLLIGNLHEHTEISSCWPAGCDGTIHDDYRFGMFSEGYDFMGITDHGYSLNEVYWRKNLRMVNFYNDQKDFVAVPSLEWTLSNGRGNVVIKSGVGHKNIVFPSNAEALKFIRNKDEIYSVRNDETKDAETLWKFLHRNNIDCVTIPHHPADEVHPTDWEVHDPFYQPIVEIFQCRGNAEYPGCPREINVTRHKPIDNSETYIDHALKNKQLQMGFIASGDHNGIGVGLAAVWVKEVSQKGILEALKSRRCFATTGDKIFIHMSVNGVWGNEETVLDAKAPEIEFQIEVVDKIKSFELLRNSKVIHNFQLHSGHTQMGSYIDKEYNSDSGVLYYYLRVIQENDHIAWSSPVWVKT